MSLILQTLNSSQQQQDGKALQFASTDLQNDPKIRTLAAVQQQARALKEAPEELKMDKEFIIMVMKANGRALEHIGEEMKGDRELCMAAVAQDWLALEFVSQEMKGDRGLCMAAVTHEAGAIKHVSMELKNDEELVLRALETYCECKRGTWSSVNKMCRIWDIPKEMGQSERVRKAAGF